MKININYPNITPKLNKLRLTKKIIILLFIISIVVCGIVNLSVGGKPWTIYVLGGEVIFYLVFLNKPLIEHTFLKKLTMIVAGICGYLYLINLIENKNWDVFVISIILFSIILLQAMILFSTYHKQKKNFMPIFITIITSLIITLLALFGIISWNWPIIVLGSCGFALLIVLFIFFKKDITKELKKKFHTN